MADKRDVYETLGISKNASADEINLEADSGIVTFNIDGIITNSFVLSFNSGFFKAKSMIALTYPNLSPISYLSPSKS